MDTKMKKGLPTPQERPDLYDDFDYVEREEGQPTGVKTPDYIQKLIDEKVAKKPAPDGKED